MTYSEQYFRDRVAAIAAESDRQLKLDGVFLFVVSLLVAAAFGLTVRMFV